MTEENASGGRRASWGRSGEQSLGRKRNFEENYNIEDNKKSRKDRDEDVYGPCDISTWADIEEYDVEKDVESFREEDKGMAKQYGDRDEDVYGPCELSSWADIKEYDDEHDADFEESKDNVEYNKKPHQDRDEDVYGPRKMSSWADIKEYDDDDDEHVAINTNISFSGIKYQKKKYLMGKGKQNGRNESRPGEGTRGRVSNRRDRNGFPKGAGSEPSASFTNKLHARQKRDILRENRYTNVPENQGRAQKSDHREPYDRAPCGQGRDDPYARDNPYSHEEQYVIGPDDPYRRGHEDLYSIGPDNRYRHGGGKDYSYGRSQDNLYAHGGRDDPYRQDVPYGRDKRDNPYANEPYSRGDPYAHDYSYAHCDPYARDIRNDPCVLDRDGPYASDRRDGPYASDRRDVPYASDIRVDPYANDRRDVPNAVDRRDVPNAVDRRDVSNAVDRRGGPYARDRREMLYGQAQDEPYLGKRNVLDRLGSRSDDPYQNRRDVHDRLGNQPDYRYPSQPKKLPRKVHGTSKDDYRRTHRLR